MGSYSETVHAWNPALVNQVYIGDGATELTDYAFYGSNVSKVYMPKSLTTFGTSLFSSSPTVYCYEYSNADYWAYSQGLNVVYIDKTDFADYGTVNAYIDNGDGTTAESVTLYRGATQQLSVSVFPAIDGQTVTWYSSDESVATVDENGLVTTRARGTVSITASVGSVSDAVVFTVQGFGDVGVLTVQDVPQRLQVGTSAQLAVVPDPVDDQLVYTWTTSDPAILTVDENGSITAVGTGKATVTAEAEGITVTSDEILAYIPITSVTIPAEFWGVAKSTTQLTWQCEPAGANPVFTWTSDHSAHAEVTVSEGGTVGCFVPGDITLTMTDEITGISASTLVHVTRPVTAIEMDPALTVSACRNVPMQMSCDASTADGSVGSHLVTYTADNDAVATVTADGLLTVLAPGTVNVTATAESGVTAVCTVTVAEELHIRKTKTEAAAETCAKDGNTEYYTCDDCGLYFTLTDGEYVQTASGSWILKRTGIHYYEGGTCRTCGQSFDLSGLDTLTLPTGLTAIRAGALSGVNAQVIIVQDSCASVGSCAFADCGNLRYIILPAALTDLASDAFAGCSEDLQIIYK